MRWLIIILNGSHEDSPNYDKRQGTADLASAEEFEQDRQINTRNTIDEDAEDNATSKKGRVIPKMSFLYNPEKQERK